MTILPLRLRPAAPSLPAASLLLLLGALLGACASAGRGPAEPGARETEAGEAPAAEHEGFEVVARVEGGGPLERVELLAPRGARREGDDPEAPAYLWRGAPMELLVAVDPASRGELLVRWVDEEGSVVGSRVVRHVDRAYTGGVARVEAPPPEELEPGEYRIEVGLFPEGSFDPGHHGFARPRPTVARALEVGIGEPRTAAIEPPAPAFPWPPPKPATRDVLPTALLGPDRPPRTLGEAAAPLLEALDVVGYSEQAFFSIQPDPSRPPQGLAVVTRLERIEPDGRPVEGDARWSPELPEREIFSLSDLVRALFTAPEGHYRVIVFTFTALPLGPPGEAPTREEAGEWLGTGRPDLPPSLADLPWTRDHACTALIYQFHQVGAGNEPEVNPGDVPRAMDQLDRTGVLAALGG